MIDIDLRKMTPQQINDAMTIKRMGVMSDTELQKLIDREIGKPVEKITNADRIRSMTDEELAVFISGRLFNGRENEIVLKWLKQEVSND